MRSLDLCSNLMDVSVFAVRVRSHTSITCRVPAGSGTANPVVVTVLTRDSNNDKTFK